MDMGPRMYSLTGPCCESGYLHMNDHDGQGPGIERCDDCKVYPDDTSASKAHSLVCDCGLTNRTSRDRVFTVVGTIREKEGQVVWYQEVNARSSKEAATAARMTMGLPRDRRDYLVVFHGTRPVEVLDRRTASNEKKTSALLASAMPSAMRRDAGRGRGGRE